MYRYAGLLRYAVDPAGAGKGLFFSYDADLTLTQQRYKAVTSVESSLRKSIAGRADTRFFFNRHLILSLIGEMLHTSIFDPASESPDLLV